MLNINKYDKLFGLGKLPGIKPVSYIIFLFLFSFKSNAQENLVPNGSFEEYYSCPQSNDLNNGQLELAKGWWKPTMGTSDYFNRCNNGVVGVPNNFWGYQEPYDGDGYVGLVAIGWYKETMEITGHEYIQTRLTQNLIPCGNYYFSMHVSCADNSQYGIGRIGVCITKDSIHNISNQVLDAIPQLIYYNAPIIDTIKWVKIDGYFKSVGGEQFLTIGYFFDDFKNDTIFIQSFPGTLDFAAYYYIDSIEFKLINTIDNCDLNIPNVFTPNNDGVNDIVDLTHYLDFIDKIRIINRWGNTVAVLSKDNPIWDGSNCVDGIYYYMIEDEKIKTKQTGFIHLVR